ncbi:hypothetical protein IX39_12110 [Chryseobacterium formosense]|uniref:Uncharacterized protein n=1 Tax=Chryseobacterium formosense TaxID=236814 RepID=A0A085ZA56_9FLAO|nr:hypothetical protein IX39_12110 [Chryseobacterium formosense]
MLMARCAFVPTNFSNLGIKDFLALYQRVGKTAKLVFLFYEFVLGFQNNPFYSYLIFSKSRLFHINSITS